MRTHTVLRVPVLALLISLILPALSARAADVIIHPGYIAGTVATATPNSVVRNISTSATGGGFSSSKSSTGNTYSMTVEGGNWNYAVDASATASPPGTSYPYTSLAFSRRNFSVAEGQSVTNDYNATGTIRFKVTITGDPYSSWYAYGYATKDASASNERTYSSSYAPSSYTPGGTWDMPLVPNNGIRIYAYVRVDSSYYYFWYYAPDYRYEDIAEGQILNIDLNVEHTTPPPPPPPPPPPTYEYGSVAGNVYLNLSSIGSMDYSDRFARHYVSGYGGVNLYTNPADYLLNARTGTWTFRARTLFSDDGKSFYLYWPYTEGDPLNDRVTVLADQTTVKDFQQDAGILTGLLSLRGTLRTEDLNAYTLSVEGATNYYVPGTGSVRQPTYGGSSSNSFSTTTDNTYRFFLTPGPWHPYYFTARSYNYDKGYYSNVQLTVYDYDHYYDGNTYNFGQPAVISPGEVVLQDREYCTGSLVVRFRVAGGGLLSSPYIGGTGYHRTEGKTDKQISVWANSSAPLMDSPELEIHGLPADYTLSTIRTVTEDGTTITLQPMTASLECGVRKGRDLSGPDLVVSSPESNLITNAASIEVTGTASDDTGISSITVNDLPASFTPTGDPDMPNQVAFTADLATVDGKNTIRTVAEDPAGNQAYDERDIYVDRWVPTVSIQSPADGSVFPADAAVALAVTSADRGYGFTLTVSVDGTVVSTVAGAANDVDWETAGYTASLSTLGPGSHTITAGVIDRAGNSASDTATFILNSPPTVQANGPYTAPEGGSVVLTATGTDPEGAVLAYAWDLDQDGVFEAAGSTVTFPAAALDGPSSWTVAVKATDDIGLSATDETTVFVLNQPPDAVLTNSTGPITEGGSATVVMSGQSDPSAADVTAGFTYAFDCTSDGVFEVIGSTDASATCAYADNGAYTATGRITDKDGGYSDHTVAVAVANAAPVITGLTGPVEPVAIAVPVSLQATFTDAGVLDTHTALWAWGDGTSSAGTVAEQQGAGSVSGSHAYTAAGVYTITLTVTDKDGGTASAVHHYAVVYDTGAGFVTGGGWIVSPTGGSVAHPAAAGKANFGFVSKYQKSSSVPTGQTEFNFTAGSVNFHSSGYEWLVVTGPKAQYKGTGTINGSGNFGFLVTVIDGGLPGGDGIDRFRISVWDRDGGDAAVYDTEPGLAPDADPTLAISGGSIKIH